MLDKTSETVMCMVAVCDRGFLQLMLVCTSSL